LTYTKNLLPLNLSFRKEIQTAQVSVITTPTLLPATPLAHRRQIWVKNTDGENSLWLGNAGATVTNGYLLAHGEEIPLDLEEGITLYGISAGSVTVTILELAKVYYAKF